MIVRKLADAAMQGRCVSAPGWESNRLLLKSDKAGFSFHITRIVKGAELEMHYQNHIEAVYCVRGQGEVVDIAGRETHSISPGTLYVLDQHDKHILRAFEELELVCVFNPPLMGREVHNAEGAYALEADAI
ncbi:ectoine synthase [Cellvibrio sp. pealriver]|uniref:ectoine synthase n=1 Tax=Cellvibrio sp. pealriver TaxID=1622269 RepID=UPI00066FD37B|nr:ectoine synthase [Cellvibrio sp. pealriver]